jgi:hypothetical protein
VDLRTSQPPEDVYLLPQGVGGIDIVGESYYGPEIAEVVGRHAEGVHAVVDAELVWEPGNRYDKNAISVRLGGSVCGYLPRDLAAEYRPAIEALTAPGRRLFVRADVRGGFRLDNGTSANYGVRIYLEEPAALLRRAAG